MKAPQSVQSLLLVAAALTVVVACGTSNSEDHEPGVVGSGGNATGGSSVGGAPTGGLAGTGGYGEASSGGASSGGQATGGATATGGTASTGTCGSWEGVLNDGSTTGDSVRIDFNEASRQESETNEPGWLSWPTNDVASDSLAADGITFTVSMTGSSGSSLTTDWYKVGVQNPNYARLVGDGLTVKDGNAGGAILVEISGLSAGTHTLLAYHNGVDGNQWANVNVDVDGTRAASGVTPSNRALSTDASASSFVTFTATAGESVTVLYSPDSSSGSSYQNVIINALALDVPDPKHQASEASPDNRDYHVDADSGSVTLSWEAAEDAVSHDVYFGTERSAVAAATPASPEYRGAQTDTTYEVSGLTNLHFYWWRIDEVNANGVTTPGAVWSFSPRHLAFPAAEGYGRFARGGRCGKVVHVTNLNDSGAGSLREAVENDIGPRTIVFDVSGVIQLESRLTLASDYVTVAGQTAPGKGICVVAAPFGISGVSDEVVRFMRVRVGYGTTYDGMGMQGSNHSIFDHNSISWSIDEAFSSRDAKNITLQRTMIAEALNVADHNNYPSGTAHGYAGTISGNAGSFHHNLLAHNEGRNFSMGAAIDGAGLFVSRLDLFNNVVYNWGGRANDGQAHEVNFVNNYYKEGGATRLHQTFSMDLENYGTGTLQAYYSGNVLENADGSMRCDGTDDSCGRRYTLSNGNPEPTWDVFPTDGPLFASYATIESARDAYKSVLSDVGASQPFFDEHDVRIVEETQTGTTTYSGSVSGSPGLPDRESDVGGLDDYPEETRPVDFDSDSDGLPNWYEVYLGTSPNSAAGDFSDSNADPDGDGYTHLDDYLEWMATPRAEVDPGSSTTFDLGPLFRGYTSSPTYTTSTDSCLTTSVADTTLTVTPTSACGLVYLPITVIDADGSTMTREIAVFVSGSVR